MTMFDDNQLTFFDNQLPQSVAETASDSCDLPQSEPAKVISTSPGPVEEKSELVSFLDGYAGRIWPAYKTRKNSVQRVLCFDAFLVSTHGHLALDDINASHIYEWLDHERTRCISKRGDKGHPKYKSPASINRYASAVSRVLNFAVSVKARADSVKLEYNREFSRERYMTDNEIEQLIQHFMDNGDHWMADLTFVGVNTGMRLGEILELGVINCGKFYSHCGEAEVHKDSIYLPAVITKTGKSRFVSVNKEVRDACLRLSKSLGSHFTHRKFYDRWNDARAKIAPGDDSFVFHSLRHTCASRMANELQMNTLIIQQQLGHQSSATTKKYVHTKPDEMAKFTDRMTLGSSIMVGDAS